MSSWTKFRDKIIKPSLAVGLVPFTGGSSLAIAAAGAIGADAASRGSSGATPSGQFDDAPFRNPPPANYSQTPAYAAGSNAPVGSRVDEVLGVPRQTAIILGVVLLALFAVLVMGRMRR